jgi:hypothetical protein
MVDMSYSVAGLQQAAAGHQDVAAEAEEVVAMLLGLEVPAAALGTVPAASQFAAGLERARLGTGRAIAAESARRLDQAGRTAATGRLGDKLVSDTTRLAGRGN